MATGYEPNIEGAIAVLRDLMIANGFTMSRQPYEPNYRGLVDAVIDFKEGFPNFAPLQVGFNATTFEAVSNGDALYLRTSDGKVGKASAADGTVENAQVVGFADADAAINSEVRVVVIGIKTLSGLDAGDLYFLSPSTAGAITLTPPSSAGQAVVRVGEASTSTKFAIRIEPPIKLS
tara:strand:- start:495 stop:1025 length:531 start_codon:yes stop_codon:yes gene_type:complete